MVQVSVRVRLPALRKARRSVVWPGSRRTSMAARKPFTYSFGTRKVWVICPADVEGTSCTCAGSLK
jgi:hypothetical protein